MRSDFRPWLSCASGGATLPTSGDAAPEPPNPRTGARGAGDRESRRSGRRGAWRQASRVARGGDLCPQEPEQQRGFVVSLHVSVIGRTLRRSSRVNKRCPRTPKVSSLLRLFEARSRARWSILAQEGGPPNAPGPPRPPPPSTYCGRGGRGVSLPWRPVLRYKGAEMQTALESCLKNGPANFLPSEVWGGFKFIQANDPRFEEHFAGITPSDRGGGVSALRAKQMTGTRPLPGEQEPPPNTGKRTLQEKDFISLVSNFIHLLAT